MIHRFTSLEFISAIGFDALINLITELLLALHFQNVDFVDFFDDLLHLLDFVLVSDGQGDTLVIVSASPAHSVQVNVDVDTLVSFPGGTHVDDEHCVANVNSSSHNIRAHQNVGLIVSELVDDQLLFFVLHVDFSSILINLGSESCSSQVLQIACLIVGEVPCQSVKPLLKFVNIECRVEEHEDLRFLLV